MKSDNGQWIVPKWMLGAAGILLASVPTGVSLSVLNRLEDRLEARIDLKVSQKEFDALRNDIAIVRVELEESRRYRVDGFARLARIEGLLGEMKK